MVVLADHRPDSYPTVMVLLFLLPYAAGLQLAAPLLVPLQALVVLRAPLTAVGVGFGVGLQHAQVFVLMLHAQLVSSRKG
jgi:hypothetical protein